MRKKTNNIIWLFLFTFYCITFRLFPFKIPNVEPILPLQMFLYKNQLFAAILFGIINNIIFDLLTNFGVFTIYTSIAFGCLPIVFNYLNKIGINNISLIIVGTLFYDFFTCLIGPITYNQNLLDALLGQIPFSIAHLIGNICFYLTMKILLIVFEKKVKKINLFQKLGSL